MPTIAASTGVSLQPCAIRAELLAPFREAVTPVALDLVDDYVPFPQEKADTPLSRRTLRYLAKVAIHPGKGSRTVVKRLRKFLAASGMRPGWRDKGATS